MPLKFERQDTARGYFYAPDMRPPLRNETAWNLSLCLLAFSLPLPYIASTCCIWLMAGCWIITGGYRHIRDGWRGMPVYWLWLLYFLLHAAGYFYCKDKTQSLFDTTSKLSFILMPLLIGGGPAIRQSLLSRILGMFIAGVTVSALFCLTRATVQWMGDHDTQHFFYHRLVSGFDANAVYMSLYVLLAICGLLFFKGDMFSEQPWARVRGWLLILLLVFFAALACRLLLVLFIVIILPLFFLKTAAVQRLSARVKAGLLFLTGTILITAAITHNPIRQRFEDLMQHDARYAFLANYYGKTPPDGNLTIRLFLWRVAIENVREHHLWLHGTGNGDAHQVINEHIIALGIQDMNEASPRVSNFWNVNLHNMYLQSLLMLGVPGLLLFLLIVGMPFFSLNRTSDRYFWLCFHLAAVLFFFQEAALQTQAAIIFYTFWSAVFWRLVKADRNEKSLASTLPDY